MGDCDVVVAELCRRAEWSLKHEMIPENQRVDIQLAEDQTSRWHFRTLKAEELTAKFLSTNGRLETVTSKPNVVSLLPDLKAATSEPEEDSEFLHIDQISPEWGGAKRDETIIQKVTMNGAFQVAKDNDKKESSGIDRADLQKPRQTIETVVLD